MRVIKQMYNIRKIAKRLHREEDGGSTIEFLLWMPLMIGMLTLTTDATLLMHKQQNLYNASRDASRQVALGQKTESEAAEILAARFSNYTVSVDVAQSGGFVTTSVSLPFSEFANVSGLFIDGSLAASATMWVENYES